MRRTQPSIATLSKRSPNRGLGSTALEQSTAAATSKKGGIIQISETIVRKVATCKTRQIAAALTHNAKPSPSKALRISIHKSLSEIRPSVLYGSQCSIDAIRPLHALRIMSDVAMLHAVIPPLLLRIFHWKMRAEIVMLARTPQQAAEKPWVGPILGRARVHSCRQVL